MATAKLTDLRTKFDTIEKRHIKRYAAEARVYMATPLGHTQARWFEVERLVKKNAEVTFGGVVEPIVVRDYGAPQGFLIGFHFSRQYEKPSLTPKTYEALIEDMGQPSVEAYHAKVEDILTAALSRGVAEIEEAAEREKQTRRANHILGCLSAEAIQKAKSLCRYEQRLAALRAELDQEIEVQARAALARVDKISVNGEALTEEVKTVVKANLERYTKDVESCDSSFFEDPTRLEVKDVFPNAPAM